MSIPTVPLEIPALNCRSLAPAGPWQYRFKRPKPRMNRRRLTICRYCRRDTTDRNLYQFSCWASTKTSVNGGHIMKLCFRRDVRAVGQWKYCTAIQTYPKTMREKDVSDNVSNIHAGQGELARWGFASNGMAVYTLARDDPAGLLTPDWKAVRLQSNEGDFCILPASSKGQKAKLVTEMKWTERRDLLGTSVWAPSSLTLQLSGPYVCQPSSPVPHARRSCWSFILSATIRKRRNQTGYWVDVQQ